MVTIHGKKYEISLSKLLHSPQINVPLLPFLLPHHNATVPFLFHPSAHNAQQALIGRKMRVGVSGREEEGKREKRRGRREEG
jgi:hypothetical protein